MVDVPPPEQNQLTNEEAIALLEDAFHPQQPRIHELRVQVGDAQIHIPPAATAVHVPPAAVVAPVLSVQAPSPVGPVGVGIEQGDTLTSVMLLLALTTGLLAQGVIGMWAFFWLRHRYTVPTPQAL